MVAMPIYGKTFKNLLLQNQKSFDAESLYIASGIRGLPSLSNDVISMLTFDLLRQSHICAPMHFYGENIEKQFINMY